MIDVGPVATGAMPRPRERSLSTAVALLTVDLAVRCLGYGAVRRVLQRSRQSAAGGAGLSEADRAAARALAARVEGSSSFRVYRVPCLPRALLLERLLAARGLPARLRIGARHDGAALQAHAWIECADQVLDPDPRVERRFPPLTA